MRHRCAPTPVIHIVPIWGDPPAISKRAAREKRERERSLNGDLREQSFQSSEPGSGPERRRSGPGESRGERDGVDGGKSAVRSIRIAVRLYIKP
eukprot:1712839-Prymnesium_polylepis.1